LVLVLELVLWCSGALVQRKLPALAKGLRIGALRVLHAACAELHCLLACLRACLLAPDYCTGMLSGRLSADKDPNQQINSPALRKADL
jgi:hypothetical protein